LCRDGNNQAKATSVSSLHSALPLLRFRPPRKWCRSLGFPESQIAPSACNGQTSLKQLSDGKGSGKRHQFMSTDTPLAVRMGTLSVRAALSTIFVAVAIAAI